jgi:hypothetical protein
MGLVGLLGSGPAAQDLATYGCCCKVYKGNFGSDSVSL